MRLVSSRSDSSAVPHRSLRAEETPELPPLGSWVERAGSRSRWFLPRWVREYATISFGLGVVPGILFYSVAQRTEEGRYGWILGLAVLALAFAGLVALLDNADKSKRLTEADKALLEDLEDWTTHLVEVKIYQDGVLTGTDRGAACFDEGCLIFSGHQTSFVVGGEDIPPRGRRQPPPGLFTANADHMLPLRHPKRDVRLDFTTLERPGDREGNAEVRFERALDLFLEHAPTSRLTRQYPPLALHPDRKVPGVVSFRARRTMAVLLVGLFGVFFGAYLGAGGNIKSAFIVLPFLTVDVALLLVESRSGERRKLLRIQSEEPNPAATALTPPIPRPPRSPT